MWYSFYFSSCKLNFAPNIMLFTLSSGSKNRQCAILFFLSFLSRRFFYLPPCAFSLCTPLSLVFYLEKPQNSACLANMETITHQGQNIHKYSAGMWGQKKGIILAAFCICQEWKCHRFSRSGTGCRGRGGIRGAIMAVRPILSPLRALLYMGRYSCCLQ